MTPFIYPYQANFIRNELNKLLRVFYFVGDQRVYHATKDALDFSIKNLFGTLTSEQTSVFKGITEIKGQQDLNDFMIQLRHYVIPFPFDEDRIRRLFKREKKLSVPDQSGFDFYTMTYLGWRDIGTKHLYLVYPYKGELTGIRTRYTPVNTNNVCSICNHAFTESETGLVVAETKSSVYKTSGNYMCLDSAICNRQMTNDKAIGKFFEKAVRK